MAVAAIVLALLFRAACVGRQNLITGICLGLAAWVAGAALQAWVPLWVMLLTGVALTVFSAAVGARPLADVLAIVALGLFSVIPVRMEVVLVGAAGFAIAGLLLDRVMRHLRPQWALMAIPVVLIAFLGLQVTQPGNFGMRLLREDPLFPLRLVLVAPSAGERLPLDRGSAAWVVKTQRDRPLGTAFVMHGNHRKGSEQPSSIALQGALLRAGYDVVSVDHPGFGAGHIPHTDAPWTDWDPTRPSVQALKHVFSLNGSLPDPAIVVGHSMGVDVALKFLADGAPVQAAYLFAGSLDRPSGPKWLSGFHRERNLSCCLPEPTMSMIRNEFYGGGDRFADDLSANHAPVHYVRFGIEHADVTASREPLLAAIPPPKKVCDFAGVSHYFNTLAIRGFVLVDARTIRRTADLFSTDGRADAACGG